MSIKLNAIGNDALPNKMQTKSFSNSFLYGKSNKVYEKELINYILGADIIDKSASSFDDIKYQIKRNQITDYLLKVLENPIVKLMYPARPLPKIFKVITAKDIKTDKKPRIFIDISDIFMLKNGVWTCRNIFILISYLLDAGNQLVYYADPKRLLMKDSIISAGAEAFSSLFTYVIDYLFKITAVSSIRDKCIYLSSMYYMINLLGKEDNDTVRGKSLKIANISEREEDMIHIAINSDKAFTNISEFISELSSYLRLPKLTIDAFVEKWIYVFGTGTQFALELYPAFAAMLTNVFVGGYLNNQNTIEKIVGRNVAEFSRAIINTCEQAF